MQDFSSLQSNSETLYKLELVKNLLPSLLNSNLDEESIKRIIDYTFDKLNLNLRNENEQVWFGDLVTISIDGSLSDDFFITCAHQKLYFGSEYDDELRYQYNEIKWDSFLGKALINSYVGDTVKYIDENDNTVHNAYIIGTERTQYSEKIDVFKECNRAANEFILKMEQKNEFDNKYPRFKLLEEARIKAKRNEEEYKEYIKFLDQKTGWTSRCKNNL